jgi:hypothetical protein
MNGDAGDLREFFLYAEFQFAGDIVDLGDGQAAVHGAVAGDQDFVAYPDHGEESSLFRLWEKVRVCIIIGKAAHTGRRSMSRATVTRTNLLLEAGKVRRLRKALQSRSNSEAVRRVIDERLAVEAGLQALHRLRKRGGLEDLFDRASAKK